MPVQPYLNFNGQCDEAIEFYKKALGAKVTMLMRFKDAPEPCPEADPAVANKVMHSSLLIGDSVVMASDGRCQGGAATFTGITLSLTVPNEAAADQSFNALAVGGKVTMPLAKTFFASSFGMVTDRFGVSWMVMATH